MTHSEPNVSDILDPAIEDVLMRHDEAMGAAYARGVNVAAGAELVDIDG
jgi:hypothetical protein